MPAPIFYVAMTIDTEPDNQWANHRNRTNDNIFWLHPLQRLLARFSARPTYLLTYNVATDPQALRTLTELLDVSPAEIGAHLHPWDNAPFTTEGWDTAHAVFPHDLPLELFERKLSALVEAISREFRPPTAHRAGRFGFVAAHARVLESLGFEVDCSVTPLLDRRDKVGRPLDQGGQGGRDFRNAPLDAYRLAYGDECRIGASRLVELPLTAGLTRRWPEHAQRWLARGPRYLRGALSRTRIARIVTASPVQFSARDITAMLASHLARGSHVINLTFHSSELMPGGSPLFPTQAEVDHLLRKLETILDWLSRRAGCRFATATEAARALARHGWVRADPSVHGHDSPAPIR
jgi:hypothetical protein